LTVYSTRPSQQNKKEWSWWQK